jgi:hypothetical protein
MAQSRRSTIVRQDAFEECCSQLGKSIRRIDEYLEAVEWAYMRNPEAFPQIPGTNVRVVRIDATAEFPAVRVFVGEEGGNLTWEYLEVVAEDEVEEDVD